MTKLFLAFNLAMACIVAFYLEATSTPDPTHAEAVKVAKAVSTLIPFKALLVVWIGGAILVLGALLIRRRYPKSPS